MLFSKFGSNFIIFFPLNRAMRLRSLCIRVVVCFCWFPELALTHFTGRAEQTASTQWAPLLTTAFKISKVCRSYLNMSPRAGKRRKLSNRRPKMRGEGNQDIGTPLIPCLSCLTHPFKPISIKIHCNFFHHLFREH